MNPNTKRSIDNQIRLVLESPEFDRLRLILVADASSEKSEADEIIKLIGDSIRSHLVEHGRAVRAVAARRGMA